MKKHINKLFLIYSMMMPTIVFASSEDSYDTVGAKALIICFGLLSIFTIILPIHNLFKEKRNTAITLYIITIVLFILAMSNPSKYAATYIFLTIFGIITMRIVAIVTKKPLFKIENKKQERIEKSDMIVYEQNENTKIICEKCGNELEIKDKFCPKCGTAASYTSKVKTLAKVTDFDPMYNNIDDKLLEVFIEKELEKAGISKKNKLIPEEILKRKKIYNIIFSILTFVYISLIFFHFPLATYIIGFIFLFIFCLYTSKYNFMKYLKKEIKARPSEKISNIIMNTKNSMIEDNSKLIGTIGIITAIALPILIFKNPVILYEPTEGGYAVRYYAFGITNYKTATIPETHNGKKVVSLRGNTFSNMPYLEKVTLPDTITEIRGQAFKNDKKLKSVNIPNKLEYLGGGAFSGCESIREVIFPDTLTYMGGEVFQGASSLTTVRLSNNLEEIRGNSFQFCYSLKSIEIPDSVTRIGGHAFQDDHSLSEVIISENSKLTEIGSSAFRTCTSLKSINLPKGTIVNERAFKESPTKINYYEK